MKLLVFALVVSFAALAMACSAAPSDPPESGEETVSATEEALKWKRVTCTPTECTINGMKCTCCGNVADCRAATKKQ